MRMPYNNFVVIADEDIDDDRDNHHLFSYRQVREELVKMCGLPKTEEQKLLLHRAVMRIWQKMPQFKINREHHVDMHRLTFVPRSPYPETEGLGYG